MFLQEPAQPPPGEWTFVRELRQPLWSDPGWQKRPPANTEADLSGGVALQQNFADQTHALAAAFADFRAFTTAAGLPQPGSYPLDICAAANLPPGAFQIEIEPAGCKLHAATAAGIRHGLHWIEDRMRAAGGPFLPLGTTLRKPWVHTRIARNFYSPIKRPPLNRDELTDNEDYYPDAYLERLARDGINGLWLSVELRDLCCSRFFPDFGRDRTRRLAKLNRSVEACARFGIRLFAFMIEPLSFGPAASQIPLAAGARHPQLLGHRQGATCYFCTGGAAGQEFLEEIVADLFAAVPGLGGIINISFGERPTHCCSGSDLLVGTGCPRCSAQGAAAVLAGTVAAMARGMHAVAPDAEMISWMYLPQIRETPAIDPERVRATLRQIAAATPPSVTLQINFESMAGEMQLGECREVLDYSLAHIGPSQLFRSCAEAAGKAGAAMSAKLQVGCSHEVATVPWVPVPGNIFRKYQAMRGLGVAAAMQCWYFGNYPSVMNRAAGRCSFEPFPADEETFLRELAAPDWGAAAPLVVRAWQLFRDAYAQFPANLLFAHYGPVHDCLCWPLHLEPVDLPIAPSWELGHPPSGDRIGECIGYFHTLGEILQLTDRVAEGWEAGLGHLLPLVHTDLRREQVREIGVAEALGLQLRSAANVLRFYALREELPWQGQPDQIQALARMRALVDAEIRLGERLAELAAGDSRLGFHSEAEGYKYFPAKLRWRADLLRQLLATEFPRVEKLVGDGAEIFAGYCGRRPVGPRAHCTHTPAEKLEAVTWEWVPVQSAPGFQWQVAANSSHLFFRVGCPSEETPPPPDTASWGDGMDADRVVVLLEPRRLWPPVRIHVDREGRVFHDDLTSRVDPRTRARVMRDGHGWTAEIEIAFQSLHRSHSGTRPLRINVQRHLHHGHPPKEWIETVPLDSRLHFGCHNPRCMGWLLLSPGP